MRSALIFSLLLCSIFGSGQVFAQNQKSEMVLTSRWFHPINSKDTLNTMKAIAEFKPDRIDWMYCDDSVLTNQLKRLKIPFSLTLNPSVADSSGYTTKKCRVYTYTGEVYVAPWMKNWKIRTPYWGCVNNPEFQQLFIQRAKQLAALGPYALFVDNPEMNARLKQDRLAGCTCDHCIDRYKRKKFLIFVSRSKIKARLADQISVLKTQPTNKSKLVQSWEQFQEQSVVEFHQNWQNELRKTHPGIKFLCNNFGGVWETFHQPFDGGIAELNPDLIYDEKLNALYHLADSLGKTQLFNSNSKQTQFHQIIVNHALRNKRDVLIPWDLYVANSDKRFFISKTTFEQIKSESKR